MMTFPSERELVKILHLTPKGLILPCGTQCFAVQQGERCPCPQISQQRVGCCFIKAIINGVSNMRNVFIKWVCCLFAWTFSVNMMLAQGPIEVMSIWFQSLLPYCLSQWHQRGHGPRWAEDRPLCLARAISDMVLCSCCLLMLLASSPSLCSGMLGRVVVANKNLAGTAAGSDPLFHDP